MQAAREDAPAPREPAAGAGDGTRRTRVRREQQRLTALNLLLLLGLGVVTTVLAQRGTLTIPHGLPSAATLVGEVAAYVLLFDVYFYALHRALHTPLAFRRVHARHHRARDVDLWSTIAMHPVEFLAIVGFVPLALSVAPVHAVSLLVVCTFLGASIAFAHSGYCFAPRTDRSLLRALYLTPRIHSAHHVHRQCNYGAITILLDRALGTLREV